MKIMFLLCSLTIFSSLIFSKTYYIDADKGNDNNTGTSSASPLKNYSSIERMKLYAGDSVLFKRGAIWNEPLHISAEGLSNNPVIFSSYGSGNLPKIDLSGIGADGIIIYNSKNVILDGFFITNIDKDSCNIKLVRSQNCIVRNCSVYVTGRAGIFMEKDNACRASHNYITTPAEMVPNQTDGIYAQRNKGNVYESNTIIDRNLSPEQHSDCIQLYRETDAVVRNNYLEQKNNKWGNAQGLYSTMGSGTHLYYNNVVFAPNTKAHLMAYLNLKEGNGKVKALNNTLSGGFMNVFRTDTQDPVVKNNIFITTCKCSMVRFDTTLSGNADVNNNFYSSNSDKPVNFMKKEISLDDWKNMGYESEGMKGDPKLDKDFAPKSGSPCINAGSDLSIIFKEDKSGTERIRKNRYDLGAYEYKGSTNL